MNFFGPSEKWLGRFGITTCAWTFHLFPRFLIPHWGFSSSQDTDEPNMYWNNFDFGWLFSISWISRK